MILLDDKLCYALVAIVLEQLDMETLHDSRHQQLLWFRIVRRMFVYKYELCTVVYHVELVNINAQNNKINNKYIINEQIMITSACLQ